MNMRLAYNPGLSQPASSPAAVLPSQQKCARSTRPSGRKRTPSRWSNAICSFSPPKAKALDTSPKRFTTRKQGICAGVELQKERK